MTRYGTTALGWFIVLCLVVYPLAFAYAYREHHRGNRTRESFVRGAGIGAIGFAILLQQAGDRWLRTPADDVVAALSLLILGGGFYALYCVYVRGIEASGDADS